MFSFGIDCSNDGVFSWISIFLASGGFLFIEVSELVSVIKSLITENNFFSELKRSLPIR